MNSFSNLLPRIKQSLAEDHAEHDITTHLLPGLKNQKLRAEVVSKASGIFCGAFLMAPVFQSLDKKSRIKILKKDGASLKVGDTVARIEAQASAILGGERVYLNLATHLSGIATLASQYVKAVGNVETVVLDTRKTTPLWRDLEKFAVVCGGGHNHRFSLEDAILIKDNHVAFLKKNKLSAAEVYGVDRLKKIRSALSFVEMEAKNLDEVWQAIKARVDIILLDNMTPAEIKKALELIKAARQGLKSDKPLVEVSGGVTLNNIRSYAELGVDRISVGALTHSVPALDLSLEVM